MAMIKKSITVTSQQDQWLQSQISKGSYASDSELFRDLIRERQTRETDSARREIVREALIEAEKSLAIKGFSDKSVAAIMEEVLERKGLNAHL